MSEQLESPTTIRDRAVAVADYLLAVRAQMERPARTVPADAHWLDALPDHPDCQVGPSVDDISWLRVGRPDLPPPVPVPAALRRRLRDGVTAVSEPLPDSAAETGNSEMSEGENPPAPDDFAVWRDQAWRPWALATAEAEKTRTLHRQLFDLMHQLDMTTTTTELVWGHGVLETTIN